MASTAVANRTVGQPNIRRTNEREGTRAHLGNLRTSPYKVREVLNLIRGHDVQRAREILRFCERGPAIPVAKLLTSAIANAAENDQLDSTELFVSACYADEGPTMKRFRPRAKGRAGKIRKRTSSITIIVSRLPEERLERLRAEQEQQTGSRRSRVAGSRAARVAGARKNNQEETAEVDEAPVAVEKSQPAEAEVETSTKEVETPDSADVTKNADSEKEGK